MKRIAFIILTTIIGFGILSPLMAQKLSAEEKALVKEWEKRKKEMMKNPLQFKKLIEEKTVLQQKNTKTQAEVEETKGQLIVKDKEMQDVKARIEELEKAKANPKTTINPEDTKGIVYKVQVGSDEKTEKDPEPRRFTMGRFTGLPEAQSFLRSVHKIGVKSARIMVYKDGKKTQELNK